ncbi:cupin 2 [Coniochaeta sp. PMI_546]|nr:cupin 2 [Coniochaeta sp. PMI_546]
MASSLPKPRRIVASNLPIKVEASNFVEPAVEVLDESLVPTSIFGGVMQRTTIATIPIVPTRNDGFGSIKLDEVPGAGVVLPSGVNVYFLDLAPGYESPMHRTVSTDYVVVHEGSPIFVTPEGPFTVVDGKGTYQSVRETMCKPGDVITQRGSMHAWANRSDRWARVLCFVVAAESQKVPIGDGKATEPLGEAWLS